MEVIWRNGSVAVSSGDGEGGAEMGELVTTRAVSLRCELVESTFIDVQPGNRSELVESASDDVEHGNSPLCALVEPQPQP